MFKTMKARARGSRILRGTLAVALVAGAPLMLTASPANAAASCTATKQVKHQTGLDYYRAAVRCTSIGSSTNVRATLDRSGAVDRHSAWFTTTNKTYYTAYASCYAGCSARTETAAR